MSIDEEYITKSFISGCHDGAGRTKITAPATTVVTDVLCGLSSKHDVAMRTVLERMIEKDSEIYEKVTQIVSDQEFQPTVYREFLNSLHTDKPLPFLPALAMCHLHKNMATSMITVYRPFFDELFRAMGIPPGSTEYNRICKGTIIRTTIKWVINALETLRLAYGIQYLKHFGNDKLIEIEHGKKNPLSTSSMILSEHIMSMKLVATRVRE